METHDFNGHQQELKTLVLQYEKMLLKGGVSFLEADKFLLLSSYYEEEDNFNLALDVINHAINQHPFSSILLIRKAQILSEQGILDDALEVLDLAEIHCPSEIDIFITKADILSKKNEEFAAIEVLNYAKQFADDKDLSDIYILLGSIHENGDHFNEALDCLYKALEYDHSNELILNKIYNLFEQMEDHTASIEYFKKYLSEHPYSFWAWFNLGLSYLSLGLVEKSTDAFDYSIVINDKFEPAYHYLIETLIQKEDFTHAIEYLNDYCIHFEEDFQTYYNYGQCFENLEAYDKAIEYYSKALQINNLEGNIYFAIGNCMMMNADYFKARNAFLDAYKINNQNEEFCMALGDAYDALKEEEKAMYYYAEALKIAPKEISIWIHIVEFLLENGRHKQALEKIAEAKIYIDNCILLYVEAAVNIIAGKKQEGFVVLQQALFENYEIHEILFELIPNYKTDPELLSVIFQYKPKEA